jgi:hypothetical protein
MKKTIAQASTSNFGHGIWNFIPKTSAIKRWKDAIKNATGCSFSQHQWEMIGHAVVIEHYDVDAIRTMIHYIAGEAGMQLHIIAHDQVSEFGKWLDVLPSNEPALIYLEPGLWLKNSAADEEDDHEWPECPTHDENKAYEFRKELANRLRTGILQQPIVFATGLQSVSQMDKQLRQAGLFDRRIEIPEICYEETAQAFMNETGIDLVDESFKSNLKRVGCLVRNEFDDHRRRSIVQKSLQRRAWSEKRKVTFNDLVLLAVYGTSECDDRLDPPEIRQRHAIHEAGHALVVYLDSKEKTPPEYCSVIKRGGTHGVVVRGYDDHERISDDLTYQDITHKIRVALGGRAAEHYLLGPTQTSASGSKSDLESATRLAAGLFGKWGHSPNISSDALAASNLEVVLGKPTPSEYAHMESMIREYLSAQFELVLNLFNANHHLLKLIADTLNEKTFLTRKDFESIIQLQNESHEQPEAIVPQAI